MIWGNEQSPSDTTDEMEAWPIAFFLVMLVLSITSGWWHPMLDKFLVWWR